MKRGQIRYSVLVFAILICFTLLIININSLMNLALTGNVINSPPSCSNESIRTIWEATFKESYVQVALFKDDILVEGKCSQYIAYKVNSAGYVPILLGHMRLENSTEDEDIQINATRIYAYFMNSTQSLKDKLNSYTTFEQAKEIIDLDLGNLKLNTSFLQANTYPKLQPMSITEAEPNYTMIYKEQIGTLQTTTEPGTNTTKYFFLRNVSNETNLITQQGEINANYTMIYWRQVGHPKIGNSSISNCTQNWSCGFTACINGTQNETCNEINNCTSNRTTSQIINCTSCIQNWQCGGWSPCISLQQTRICNEINNCTSNITRTETQACIECIPNWNCTNWTVCKSGNQTRTCNDINSCGTLVGKPSEKQACTKDDSNIMFIVIIIAIIFSILIVGIIAYLFWIKNKPEYIDNSSNSKAFNTGYPPGTFPPSNQAYAQTSRQPVQQIQTFQQLRQMAQQNQYSQNQYRQQNQESSF